MVAGVCAGLAAYFKVDVTLVRLAFGISTFIYGIGALAYVIAWALVPEEGEQADSQQNQACRHHQYSPARQTVTDGSGERRKHQKRRNGKSCVALWRTLPMSSWSIRNRALRTWC